MHGAGLEVKRSPISGIISIFVTFQSLYFSLGGNMSHAPHTYIRNAGIIIVWQLSIMFLASHYDN